MKPTNSPAAACHPAGLFVFRDDAAAIRPLRSSGEESRDELAEGATCERQ